jgi:hypothetical protein
MSTNCPPLTLAARVQSYLSDDRVTELELADLGHELAKKQPMSPDDAIAVADLLNNHPDKMSTWSKLMLGWVRPMLPADVRITLDAGAKAKDGRLTRADVVELLSGAGNDGFSEAELKGLRGVLAAFGPRIDPDARALLAQGIANANTCLDTYAPPQRPKLFGIF